MNVLKKSTLKKVFEESVVSDFVRINRSECVCFFQRNYGMKNESCMSCALRRHFFNTLLTLHWSIKGGASSTVALYLIEKKHTHEEKSEEKKRHHCILTVDIK